MGKRTQTKQTFVDYFSKTDLGESLKINESGKILYHWSNDPKAIEKYKEKMLVDSTLKKRLDKLRHECESYENTAIWLSSKKGTLPSTLRHLYESYLDPRMRLIWHKMEDIMVSFSDPLGPYVSLKSMRWFKEDAYRSFVYRKMFESWIPSRKYRLNLNIAITMSKEKNPYDRRPASIHQVSAEGVLLRFKANDRSFLAMNFGGGHLCIRKDNEERPDKYKRHSFSKGALNYDVWWHALKNFQVNQTYVSRTLDADKYRQGDYSYIFIPYSAMTGFNNMDTTLRDLLQESQHHIHQYLDAA